MIHRDLKPENILLNSIIDGVFDVRIADFGFATTIVEARELFEKRPDLICGTPGYMAPESLNGLGYSLKSDIFSAGSIIYSILTKRNLFYG